MIAGGGGNIAGVITGTIIGVRSLVVLVKIYVFERMDDGLKMVL